MLTNGQFDAISLENTSLPEDFLLPAEPVPEDIGLPPLRGKRQAQTGIYIHLVCRACDGAGGMRDGMYIDGVGGGGGGCTCTLMGEEGGQ